MSRRQESRHPPSVSLEAPTLVMTATWYKPHQAKISVRTTGNVTLLDAIGALAEGIKLTMSASAQKVDVPEISDVSAAKPTFRPERVA